MLLGSVAKYSAGKRQKLETNAFFFWNAHSSSPLGLRTKIVYISSLDTYYLETQLYSQYLREVRTGRCWVEEGEARRADSWGGESTAEHDSEESYQVV